MTGCKYTAAIVTDIRASESTITHIVNGQCICKCRVWAGSPSSGEVSLDMAAGVKWMAPVAGLNAPHSRLLGLHQTIHSSQSKDKPAAVLAVMLYTQLS